MSPVHVIVGDDPRAEAMWANAFTGAVDLYAFPRNVDAFERLTAAQAPVDLVVLTPAQRGPFNLTPDQFVARVLEGPLGSSSCLRDLHVIVVGAPLHRSHPRAMAVSTLDAAIRLVKFGEVERAPRPASMQASGPVAPPVAAAADRSLEPRDDLPFAGSVISRIWEAGDEAAVSPRVEPVPAAPATPVAPVPAPAAAPDAGAPVPRHDVTGGGAAASSPPLFTRAAPRGFVAAGGGPATQVEAAPAVPVGAPHETIEVGTGGLQAARPFQLDGGGAYRGPSVRGGVVNAAAHDQFGGQPVPPALASQVEAMVYGGVQVGNPHDPVMIWSSAARAAAAPAPAVAAPVPGAQPAPVPTAMAMRVRTVPMEPPAGAYGAPAGLAAPVAPADPFLARAEAQGTGVSFG